MLYRKQISSLVDVFIDPISVASFLAAIVTTMSMQFLLMALMYLFQIIWGANFRLSPNIGQTPGTNRKSSG